MTRFFTLFLVLCLGFVLNGAANATAFQLLVSKTGYQSQLAGDWEVDSEVIWSESAYVHEGDLSKSEIVISDIHGSLYPQWKAEDWKLVRNKVIDFNIDKSIHWERESKLTTTEGEYWFVKSINKFKYTKKGTIEGKSYHKQYLNGEYVGSYVTMSKLTRKDKAEYVASN